MTASDPGSWCTIPAQAGGLSNKEPKEAHLFIRMKLGYRTVKKYLIFKIFAQNSFRSF
jgi:hypothetical protein